MYTMDMGTGRTHVTFTSRLQSTCRVTRNWITPDDPARGSWVSKRYKALRAEEMKIVGQHRLATAVRNPGSGYRVEPPSGEPLAKHQKNIKIIPETVGFHGQTRWFWGSKIGPEPIKCCFSFQWFSMAKDHPGKEFSRNSRQIARIYQWNTDGLWLKPQCGFSRQKLGVNPVGKWAIPSDIGTSERLKQRKKGDSIK